MDTQRLETLLAATTRLGASALHLVPGRKPSLRVQRRFVAGDELPVQSRDVEELTRDMLFADHRERLATAGHVEVLYVSRAGRRCRATISTTAGQMSLVLRPLPAGTPKLETLELPEQIGAFADARNGLVVVAGFFGSGKSTTLAAIVDRLNRDPSRHVVTIEDSIEYVHGNGAALLHQREVGTHVDSTAAGIRQAVATGVDAIVVGELRCAEALDAALTAAESGCLVFAGVEAGSIVGALTDLSLRVPEEQRPRFLTRLSRVLRGATAQSLLQRSHRAGRVAVVEILIQHQAARTAIRDGDLLELNAIMQRCRGLGMQTADLALRALLAHHQITQEEALLHATHRDEVFARGPVAAPAR